MAPNSARGKVSGCRPAPEVRHLAAWTTGNRQDPFRHIWRGSVQGFEATDCPPLAQRSDSSITYSSRAQASLTGSHVDMSCGSRAIRAPRSHFSSNRGDSHCKHVHMAHSRVAMSATCELTFSAAQVVPEWRGKLSMDRLLRDVDKRAPCRPEQRD
jgi:hypothetical protein